MLTEVNGRWDAAGRKEGIAYNEPKSVKWAASLSFCPTWRTDSSAERSAKPELASAAKQEKKKMKDGRVRRGEERRRDGMGWDGMGRDWERGKEKQECIKRLANDLHWLQCVLREMETGSHPLPLTLSDDTLQLAAATSQTDLMLFHKRVVCGGESSRRWEYFTRFHLVYGTTWTLREDSVYSTVFSPFPHNFSQILFLFQF